MRVLILGASGLIGGNLLRHLNQELNWNSIGTYFSYKTDGCVFYNTLDPNDTENFDVHSFIPEVIVHCGALTWVDYCEDHEIESFEKTVTSTKNTLELAKKTGAKFIYLSTDYVFDGKTGPYREDAITNPVSVYGSHKLLAENMVKESGLDYLILRVTNVYGDEERGKNFIARLVEKAKNKEEEEMQFPIDQFATPVNASDVAIAISLLIESKKKGTFNLGSTDYVNRLQLAKMVLKHFPDNKITLRPILTEEMKQKAERPLNGGLLSDKFLSEFPYFEFSNVDDYIVKLKTQ